MGKLSYTQLQQMLVEAAQKVPIDSMWRHYKGHNYTVTGLVIVEATDEVAVLYAPLEHPGVSFIRPLSSWLETVEVDSEKVPRFAPVA